MLAHHSDTTNGQLAAKSTVHVQSSYTTRPPSTGGSLPHTGIPYCRLFCLGDVYTNTDTFETPFLNILAFSSTLRRAKTECLKKNSFQHGCIWHFQQIPFCSVDCVKGGFQKQWGMFKRDSYCTNRYNGICLIIGGLVRDKSFKVHWSEPLFILHSCKCQNLLQLLSCCETWGQLHFRLLGMAIECDLDAPVSREIFC